MKLKDKIAVISGAVIPVDGGLSAAMESPGKDNPHRWEGDTCEVWHLFHWR
jgi:hypothetical protein